jgi:hypothetical protein
MYVRSLLMISCHCLSIVKMLCIRIGSTFWTLESFTTVVLFHGQLACILWNTYLSVTITIIAAHLKSDTQKAFVDDGELWYLECRCEALFGVEELCT